MSKKKSKAIEVKKDPVILVVSYVPLLRGKPGITYDYQTERATVEQLLRQVEQLPTARAQCCLWMLDDDNQPMAVLALKQAEAIADHLKEWADNEPHKWFRVYLKEKDGKYALVLFPEMQQSVDRFKFAHLLAGGDVLTSNKVQLIAHPLHFVSGLASAYAALKQRLGKTLKVGLVEMDLLDPNNPFQLDPGKIRELGTFTVGDSSAAGLDAYLAEMIDGATEPPTYPSRINPAAKDRLC